MLLHFGSTDPVGWRCVMKMQTLSLADWFWLLAILIGLLLTGVVI